MDGVVRTLARVMGNGALGVAGLGEQEAHRPCQRLLVQAAVPLGLVAPGRGVVGAGRSGRALAGLAVIGLLLGAGCENAPPAAPVSGTPAAAPSAAAPAAVPATPAAPVGTVNRYGGNLEPAATVPLPTLLANPKAYAEQTVTTEGKVQRACSRKGCWMEIGDGDDACRVTFKDYAFFVPTDSAGSHAKIQGKLDTREVEAAAVAHLESEGAHFKHKNADGSATEVRMIASAVELQR